MISRMKKQAIEEPHSLEIYLTSSLGGPFEPGVVGVAMVLSENVNEEKVFPILPNSILRIPTGVDR